MHERKRSFGGVCDHGGAGDSARMVQYGGGLGGAKFDKALVAGTLDHALSGLAGGGVDVHGHDAHLALARCRLALARSARSCSHRAAVVQLPALKAPVLRGRYPGRGSGQNVHGLQQQTAAGA